MVVWGSWLSPFLIGLFRYPFTGFVFSARNTYDMTVRTGRYYEDH